jgi:hypothetical protein
MTRDENYRYRRGSATALLKTADRKRACTLAANSKHPLPSHPIATMPPQSYDCRILLEYHVMRGPPTMVVGLVAAALMFCKSGNTIVGKAVLAVVAARAIGDGNSGCSPTWDRANGQGSTESEHTDMIYRSIRAGA